LKSGKSRFDRIVSALAWICVAQFPAAALLVLVFFGPEVLNRLFFLIVLGISLFICVYAIAVLRVSNPETRAGLVVSLAVVMLCLAAIDLWFGRTARYHALADAVETAGIEFDWRKNPDVVLDDRAAGTVSYPDLTPRSFYLRPLEIGNERIYPLAGIARVKTVLCNESGSYVRYDSDELGFNNPAGTWSAGKPFDVILIGDSFAQGWCVPPSRTAAGVLRQSGVRVGSFGHGGLGTLGALAIAREYVPAVRARVAAWLWYSGNDEADFREEREMAVYRRYMSEPAWTQRLLERRDNIDAAMRDWAETQLARYDRHRWFPFFRWRAVIRDVPVTRMVRDWAGLSDGAAAPTTAPATAPAEARDAAPEIALETVVDRVFAELRGRDMALVFVYIPSRGEMASGARPPLKARLLARAEAAKVRTIDMEAAFRRRGLGAGDVFPLPAETHFNETGHRILAEEIAAAIASRN
jgi:hypothetical protein